MLTGIHFLLSYMCNSECDHCFVYSSPQAKGTFTVNQIRNLLDDVKKIGSIEWAYFEGGEPFLFYPILLEAVKYAKSIGFKIGIVTNAYFATSLEDLQYWLKPLAEIGIDDLTVSDDPLHFGELEESENPAQRVVKYAKELNIPISSICVVKPTVSELQDEYQEDESPIIDSIGGLADIDNGGGGGVMFRGRAVEKLEQGLTKHPWETFTECPHEDLLDPKRVHIDPFGNVHLCQGLCMGNVNDIPLSKLVERYDVYFHPICKLLVEGGPSELVMEYGLDHEDQYVDACHLCFVARLSLMERFPEYLCPKQIYGLE